MAETAEHPCAVYLRALARIVHENEDTVQVYAIYREEGEAMSPPSPDAQARLLDAFLKDPNFQGGPHPKAPVVSGLSTWPLQNTQSMYRPATPPRRHFTVSAGRMRGDDVLCCQVKP